MLPDVQQTVVQPHLDPYGLLPILERASSRQIGWFAQPFLWHAQHGTAGMGMLHVLDLCGWVLSVREASAE